MLSLLLALAAHPADLPPFARTEESLRARYYKKIDGEGPVWPRWRRKWSPIRAWTFPEGMAQRVQVWEGRRLAEERRYTAGGRPLTAVSWSEDEVPAEVAVFAWGREARFDPATWSPHTLHRVVLIAPGEPTEPQASELRWELPEGVLSAAVVAGPADVFSEAYLSEGLLTTCGCIAEDRATTWVDGRVGARYRVRLVGLERLAEVWAVPEDDAVLLVTWSPEDEADLALGRAVLALTRWEDDA